ncbi:hypothetical protein DBR00_18255 [Pseudomonas sp. HMWF032]|uniref:hypothetical protein n=1 Tax=Pseudomonas sp. HMWF032 TaxID=2056866 RepID=UPI000D36B4CA|nr:hypothetical protein [Pseudomonas sp. HMWF032]PTS82060.1 hypothetical protein DBR00_18255 [Pseudomonas sp. HMWF032]PTT80648.1 hypothetical protein DBR41_18895 [Pseudomonas sp. HMWF010]
MDSIPLERAKQKFIFYVAQDLDQSIRSNVQQLVNEVAASRIWSVTPPSFIDEIDETGAEVVGGMLEIYSALQPNVLPIEMDSKNLDDVEALVGAVKKLSEKENLSFEFQLDTTFVGAIDDGVIDRVLLDGLLVPWRNHIKGKS